jgi:ribosomal protein S18 acetylase RimI-like enzyme
MPEVRSLRPDDAAWAEAVERDAWNGDVVVRRGEAVALRTLPGLVAWCDGRRAGMARYAVRGDACELVALLALEEGRGVGRALMAGVRDIAVAAGCRALWVITTNDNTRALRLYQRFGFDLVALHRGAVDAARRVKPSISEVGADGIPMHHELELRLAL